MKKRLVTSALPYVNNIPHLGNLIQVLSADVFARFCRLAGYETLYICGTDEYGTATETKALEEGVSPRELCDRFHAVHSEIYGWFNISFDKFGRTSCAEQSEITRHIFSRLDENGYIKERSGDQLYCGDCGRFLADRYVRGECPHCGYGEARGDQCESCGRLLEPAELGDPRCGVCGASPSLRATRHLYIDLPAIRPVLERWIQGASVRGFWSRNAVKMTEAWIRDGLHERAITRDLKWGIPVPRPGYEDKVFYVWFDAPIGYISITASLRKDWEAWWRNPEDVELFQFIGKDNIPFHTVIFPSSLLGSGEKWTMLHHISSTEYLNYEDGKFSKSKGVGVFGTDARDSGIPADVWRFYIFYNRPETSDYLFTWKDFQEKVNAELIGNLANLVNRALSFVVRYYSGRVPDAPEDAGFWVEAAAREKLVREHYERAGLRDALRETLALSSLGNKIFQDGEPWKTRNSDPQKAAVLIRTLVYLIRDLSVLCAPVIPATAEKIAGFLGLKNLTWDDLSSRQGITVVTSEILFKKLEDAQIAGLRSRFSGTQAERREKTAAADAEKTAKGGAGNAENAGTAGPAGNGAAAETESSLERPSESLEEKFAARLRLKVAKITKIERHPDAQKLYIESVSLGAEERTIVSGLVPYYTEEELLGKNIILVSNLKPAKLRGVVSSGMLLAASADGAVEVIFAPGAAPGDDVLLSAGAGGASADEDAGGGCGGAAAVAAPGPAPEIDIDAFFSIPITARGGRVFVGNTPLEAGGKPLQTEKVKDGKVG
ncbi:MAG: methionine--tRNA ligase [Spirochaetales bacterium]|jgi:methionyl-tRNA synthetase|nr:methionine--tRNA ligase [Spirochaetales bacterium]